MRDVLLICPFFQPPRAAAEGLVDYLKVQSEAYGGCADLPTLYVYQERKDEVLRSGWRKSHWRKENTSSSKRPSQIQFQCLCTVYSYKYYLSSDRNFNDNGPHPFFSGASASCWTRPACSWRSSSTWPSWASCFSRSTSSTRPTRSSGRSRTQITCCR